MLVMSAKNNDNPLNYYVCGLLAKYHKDTNLALEF